MGDIGSHWMDMIQHLTGLKITALCADLQIFHKTRKKPKGAVETFSGKKLKPEDYTEIPIDTEDFGAVLIRLGDRARGSFTVSQMSAGCKNRFQFEIFGTKGGVAWNQERPDELWIGQSQRAEQIIVKDRSLLYPARAAIRRSARRSQRRLRRRAQAGLQALLQARWPIPLRRSITRLSRTGCGACNCSRRFSKSSQKGGWVTTGAQGASA